jgi:hypothetical protein
MAQTARGEWRRQLARSVPFRQPGNPSPTEWMRGTHGFASHPCGWFAFIDGLARWLVKQDEWGKRPCFLLHNNRLQKLGLQLGICQGANIITPDTARRRGADWAPRQAQPQQAELNSIPLTSLVPYWPHRGLAVGPDSNPPPLLPDFCTGRFFLFSAESARASQAYRVAVAGWPPPGPSARVENTPRPDRGLGPFPQGSVKQGRGHGAGPRREQPPRRAKGVPVGVVFL